MLWSCASRTCRRVIAPQYTTPVRRTITTSPSYHYRQEYYDLLGVEKTSSQEEIKSAYLEKTKLYHPDANPDNDEAHAMFLKVKKAYEQIQEEQVELQEREAEQVEKEKSTRKEYDDSPLEFNLFSLNGLILCTAIGTAFYTMFRPRSEERTEKKIMERIRRQKAELELATKNNGGGG